MVDDPYEVLGVAPGADADAIRAARRRLAKVNHPDAGGDAGSMAAVNAAAEQALDSLGVGESAPISSARPVDDAAAPSRFVSDVPSFTVEALPVETFEALVVVASWIGEVLDDDPPYRLDVLLREPAVCWCRLDVVPDAGSSTVSITLGSIDRAALPDIDTVRDTWITHLNQLDWPT